METRPHPTPVPGPRRILVTGDTTLDWNLAHTHGRTEMYCSPGGAAALTSLLADVSATLAEDGLDVQINGPELAPGPVSPLDSSLHHRYTLWSDYPYRLGDRSRRTWRVQSSLGLDRAVTPEWSPVAGPPDADLVIIDDANLGFRDAPALWPELRGQSAGPQPWVIARLASPVAHGPLWRRLIDSAADRLFVVMTLDDLQLSDVKISRELSWERTAGDVVRELIRHPAVNSLARCAHVLVSLEACGAVLLSRRPGAAHQLDQLDCHVFFDPESMGSSWADQYPGAMVGYTLFLLAAVAREFLLDPAHPDLHRGVRLGLSAERALHLAGYGDAGDGDVRAALAPPAAAMAKRLQAGSSEFQVAVVDHPVSESWSILEARYPEGLEPVAQDVALRGVEGALTDVPLGRFDKLVTVDRGEIEGFRSIGALIREYDAEPAARPLN
ncbi:MAG TPA: hypothetical protein VFH56_07430, partial [Acidimicrobiales bacterium]|nr:hypothetical protein [Acidimicrobiales bacterium]